MIPSTIGIVAGFNRKAALTLREQLCRRFDGTLVLSTDDFIQTPDMHRRERFVIEQCLHLQSLGCERILVPDFASGLFIERVREALETEVVDILTALEDELKDAPDTIGILDNVYVPGGVFERVVLCDTLQSALNANRERMRTLGVTESTLAPIAECCRYLTSNGAQRILPNCSHYANAYDELRSLGLPIIDVYAVFLDAALA